MELVPTQDEVLALLRETGALQNGHFECLNGLHTDINLETALAMRYHRNAKTLSVGLSRKLRANPELRALIPEFSIVSATPAGLPVAYGLCEALARAPGLLGGKGRPRRAHALPPVSGAGGGREGRPGRRPAALRHAAHRGAPVARSPRRAGGARMAVLVYQPTPQTRDFGSLPLYYLAKLDATYYADAGSCEFCRRHVPLHQVGLVRQVQEDEELVTAGAL